MPKTVFINGRYCAPEEAHVSIFDRGLLFGDAIYEVAGVFGGKLTDFHIHMERLDRSLKEMGFASPVSHHEILEIMRELVRLNDVDNGLIYLQITRGNEGDRDFMPHNSATPNVFAFAQHLGEKDWAEFENGIVMASAPDIRWGRRDIKTTQLMGSVMAKKAAKANVANASEVLMHEDGYITEGGATSFYIVKDGKVITRPLSNAILPGCTRRALLALMAEGDIELEERLFTLEEVYDADEAFITGASTFSPVIQIDDTIYGNGAPGPVTKRLQKLYRDEAMASAL